MFISHLEYDIKILLTESTLFGEKYFMTDDFRLNSR